MVCIEEGAQSYNYIRENVRGYADESINDLNGLRVRFKGEWEGGTVFNVYLDRKNKVALVSVNMDRGGSRTGFHDDLELIGSKYELLKRLIS